MIKVTLIGMAAFLGLLAVTGNWFIAFPIALIVSIWLEMRHRHKESGL